MRTRSLFLALVLILVVAACSPGTRTAQVAYISHADGDVIMGSRTVTLQLRLTDAAPDAVIEVVSNTLRVERARAGDLLTLTVDLKDNENTIDVRVANPGQPEASVATLHLVYPFMSLGNGQGAAFVIGQADFDSTGEVATNKSFDGPYGRANITNGVLYLPDYGRARVMGYLQVTTPTGAAADFVLGKTDFDDNADVPGPAGMRGPQHVVGYDGRLYVLDYSWSRILVFDTPPTTSGAAADHVIGQPDFVTVGYSTSSTTFNYPEGMTIGGGRLIVADTDNNRVLIWNAVPADGSVPADIVLGQTDMDSSAVNGGGPVSASSLRYPNDAWSDGERLVVSDGGNNRVLVWTSFPTVNNAPADIVIGQADDASSGYGLGPAQLSSPYGVASNGNQLFVVDSDNNRILVWDDLAGLTTGASADRVLGQIDFLSDAYAVSRTGFDYPTGVYVHGNDLVVADNDNYRYLVFQGANP